jgi:hypothetical protein
LAQKPNHYLLCRINDKGTKPVNWSKPSNKWMDLPRFFRPATSGFVEKGEMLG